MTVMEALQWANNKLKKAQISSPMLDAEMLLAHVMEQKKSWIFAHFPDKLPTHREEAFREAVERRAAREPMAYITGTKPFYNRTFQVTPDTLIPRPETETLIDASLEVFKHTDKERTMICDIGTGPGTIGLTLAAETALPTMISDASKEALIVAEKNKKTLLQNDTDVHIAQGDLALPLIQMFRKIRSQPDVQTSWTYPFSSLIITANLPYLREDAIEKLQPEIQNHEPHLALVAGQDGLDAYRKLFQQLEEARDLLPKHTHVFIEIDPEQVSSSIALVLKHFPKAEYRIHKDLLKLDRIIHIEL